MRQAMIWAKHNLSYPFQVPSLLFYVMISIGAKGSVRQQGSTWETSIWEGRVSKDGDHYSGVFLEKILNAENLYCLGVSNLVILISNLYHFM